MTFTVEFDRLVLINVGSHALLVFLLGLFRVTEFVRVGVVLYVWLGIGEEKSMYYFVIIKKCLMIYGYRYIMYLS